MPNREILGRLGAEFVVVVLGVVLALAADSWREAAIERRVEAEYLDRLAEDLSASVQAFGSRQERDARVQQAGRALLAALDEGDSVDADSLLALALTATGAGILRSTLGPDGTYRELQVSGRLALLQDSELRRRLVEFYQRVDDTYLSMTDASTGAVTNRVSRAIASFPRNVDVEDLGIGDRRRLLLEVRENPDFAGDLRHLMAKLRVNEGRYDRLRILAEELLEVIRTNRAGAA